MSKILLITAIIAVFISNVFAFEMKLNTLHLVAKVNGKTSQQGEFVFADENSVVTQVMDSYGINYETVLLPADNLKLEDGKVALYNTIVIEGATQGQLNQVIQQIRDYQKKYKIRVIYLNCEPDVNLGFKPADSIVGIKNILGRQVKLTKEGIELAHKYQMKGDDVAFNVETCVLRDPTVAGGCIAYAHYEVAYDDVPNVKVTPLLTYHDLPADPQAQTQTTEQPKTQAKTTTQQNQQNAQPKAGQKKGQAKAIQKLQRRAKGNAQAQPAAQQNAQPAAQQNAQPAAQQEAQPAAQQNAQPAAQQNAQPAATQPAATQPAATAQKSQAIGGAIVDNNGLEEMHFWVSNIESHIAFFIGHIWVSWGNYGLIDGYRRLYMEIQIDDYFTDNCFKKGDCEGKREPPNVPHYRTSVQDMINLAQWHHDVSGRLPKGSDIKIELAINGIHILTETQHKIQGVFTDWDVPQTNYSYVKQPGDPETHRWPQSIDLDWEDDVLQSQDPLYKHFKDPKNQDNFYWLTHTFTHLKLDAASSYDSDMEMSVNIKMSKEPYLGMYDRPCYSQHSIVTPEISGLHNGDNLRAFEKNKVYYAVGDTSRTDLNPGNFYFPFISNQTTSNFDGFVVFPRQPPQVYWDCSTIEENMIEYYERYPTRTDVTWEKHLDEEAELHIRNFLKLRHDPYMFHEGNLRNADFPTVTIGTATGNFGMMQQWVERMVVELNRYLNWPILSIKMDDLAAVYIDRISRSKCQPQYTMVIDDKTGIISEVKVESKEDIGKLEIVGDYKAKCRAPLLVMRDKTSFLESNLDDGKPEKVGDEPPTGWITLESPGKAKAFKFDHEIKYNDEGFVGKELSESFFSKYKLYFIIGLGILLLLIISFFVVRMIRGRKSGNQSYSTNNQYQPQQNNYNQNSYNQSGYNQNGYSQNMYDRNRDYMDNQRGPRSPRNNRDDYQDYQKQKDYKNYRQLYD